MTRNSVQQLLLAATALGTILVSTACQQTSPVARMQTAIEAAPTATTTEASAALFVRQAREALTQHDNIAAVSFAELAVRAEPYNAEARRMLALSYLNAGRFRSASEAYSDLLQMGADDSARLRRALALLAGGDRASAMSELATLRDPSIASDVGLTYALAGDTQQGLAMMTEAARAVDATPRVRQNLALGYALAGQWAQARAVAAQDLDAAAVEKRIQEWATFAANSDVSWKTFHLLAVTPAAEDAGRPVALAYAPPTPTDAAPAEQTADSVPPAPASEPETAFVAQNPAVAPEPSPIVQPIAESVRPVANRMPVTSANGRWVVQLGAYASNAILKANWRQATRRNAELLGDKTPIRTAVQAGNARLVRLAVGKFSTREDAAELCRALRDRGAECFVRADAKPVRATGTGRA